MEMSWAGAACSAASSQRPAQNSTQERPQSARALRGSSRSCQSSCSRSRQFAGRVLSSKLARRCSRSPSVASCTSRSPPTAGREVEQSVKRSLGSPPRRRTTRGSLAPREHARRACRRRAARRARVAARAWSMPPLEARRPREAAVDDGLERRARRRLPQRLLEQRDAVVETLQLGKEHEDLRRATSRSPARRAGRSRSSWRASTRRQCDARELRRAHDDGAHRTRPAASAGAPARRARPRPPTAPRSAARLAALVEHVGNGGSPARSIESAR